MGQAVANVALKPSVRVAVAVVAGLIALAWIPGALHHADESLPGLWRFDLDGERLVPAAISALLLLATAALAASVATRTGARGARVAFGFLALLFCFMAVDEWFAVHEGLEDSSGSDWQTLYLGLGVVAAAAWAYALRLLGGASRALWVAGAVSWAVAQAIERVQWDGDQLVYPWTVLPEELLEMVGTACWLLALLLALRGALRARLGDHVGDHQDQQH